MANLGVPAASKAHTRSDTNSQRLGYSEKFYKQVNIYLAGSSRMSMILMSEFFYERNCIEVRSCKYMWVNDYTSLSRIVVDL